MKKSDYDKKYTRHYSLKLNTKTDNDIIEYLDCVHNFQGFIKKIIRGFINERSKKDQD